jgi:hypothetical protein
MQIDDPINLERYVTIMTLRPTIDPLCLKMGTSEQHTVLKMSVPLEMMILCIYNRFWYELALSVIPGANRHRIFLKSGIRRSPYS